MSAENRVWTQNPNARIPAANFNSLQDSLVMSWELNHSTLLPAAPMRGATLYYGQVRCLAGACVLLDDSRNWRNRMIVTSTILVDAANKLPGGVAYNPNPAGATASAIDIPWHTMAGATYAVPPIWVLGTGASLIIGALGANNQTLFASSTVSAGALCICNEDAADYWAIVQVCQYSPTV